MKKQDKKQLISVVYALIGLALVVAVWGISALIIQNEYVMPSIGDTIKEIFSLFGEGNFWLAFLWTIIRTIIAFCVSFVLAGLTAGLGLLFKPLGGILKPIVSIIRVVPTMAVLLLILLWSKVSVAPVIITSLVLYPMIYTQFITAFEGVDQGVLSATKVFGLSKKDKLFKVYLPTIAPSLLSHVGPNLSFGVKLTVSAEVMAYTLTSLGGMMNTANAYLNIARLAGLTIFAIIIGLVFEGVCALIIKLAFKWTKGEMNND